MVKSLRGFTLIAVASVPFAFAPLGIVAAQEKKPAMQSETTALRSVPASKGRVVPAGTKLKMSGKNSGITCCTHWNTSTGGTGCSTQPGDECPGGQFKVDCGPSGCW